MDFMEQMKELHDKAEYVRAVYFTDSTLLSTIFAVNPARAARLFMSKTSGQSLAQNTVNGLVRSDLVHIASRLFRTLRRSLVILSLTSGNGLSINPLHFSAVRMPPKNLVLSALRRFETHRGF